VQVTGVHSWSGAIDDLTVTDESSKKRYPCALLWYMLAVNADGNVSICNVDWDRSGVVGNVNEHSLHDIWNNPKMKAIRKKQLEGCWNSPKVCEDCVLWVSVGDMKKSLEERQEFWR
jgi:radical SAM protein with 4Fe4S-binding SPASM domain